MIDVDVVTAFAHLKGADVLVHTGSSFPASAGLAAPNPQLFFQSPPKETRWGGGSQASTINFAVYHCYSAPANITCESCECAANLGTGLIYGLYQATYAMLAAVTLNNDGDLERRQSFPIDSVSAISAAAVLADSVAVNATTIYAPRVHRILQVFV